MNPRLPDYQTDNPTNLYCGLGGIRLAIIHDDISTRFIINVVMDLFVKLYRLESQRLKSSEIYYLVRDIRAKDRAVKVRVKIGKTHPTHDEETELTSKPNIDLEKKVLAKKLHLSEGRYRVRYLQPEHQRRLEESRHWGEFFSLFLTTSEMEQLEANNEVEYVHGTTAIEGNTFTGQQVDELIQNGVAPSGKSLREINEVQNYIQVRKYRDSYRGKVTTPFIRRLHEIIMDKIDTQSAGKFRRIDNIGIRGVDIAVTPAILIEAELQRAIEDYHGNVKAGWHPFEEAVLFHHRFESIHPFLDGNGRVGREILNHMLTRSGYPRLIVPKAGRERYLDALLRGNKEEYESMITGFVDLLIDKRADLFGDIMSGKVEPGTQTPSPSD
ncbi:MAG: Fic family protein [Candidatus Bathyarchaeia archaeon]